MGFLTLAGFREEVSSAVSGTSRNLSSTRVDRWVNLGYEELLGSVEFEELDAIVAIGSHTNFFEIPANIRIVKGLTTDRGLLQWVSQTEFMRLADNVPGEYLEYWTRIGKDIFLTPPVASGEQISVLAYTIPEPLELDADVSALPAGWDAAIIYFSISIGLGLLGDSMEATNWYNRAVAFVESRAKEEQRKLIRPGLGATLPHDIRVATAIQGGA